MTKYIATLQFEADGPAVSGEWSEKATALRTYRDWIGLYGSDPGVVIRLVEETAGERRVLETWTADGVEPGP